VSLTKVLELAMQLDRLESLPRMGWLMRGVRQPESVAAHVFGVACWAMLLADRLDGIDVLKVLRMALLHELGEIKLTDIPRIAESYLPAGAKDAAERRIAAELLAPLGEQGEAYLALFAEYQAGQSLEARLVRGADKLQMMGKTLCYEQDGYRRLAEFWRFPPNFADHEIPEVRTLFAELRARRATVSAEPAAEP